MENDAGGFGMVGDVFRQICSGVAGNVRIFAYRSLFTVASVITIVRINTNECLVMSSPYHVYLSNECTVTFWKCAMSTRKISYLHIHVGTCTCDMPHITLPL